MDVGKYSFSGILDKGTYAIPNYQRPYSWLNLQWGCLFEDMTIMLEREFRADKMTSGKKSQSSHFMGATVFHEIDPEEFRIVDGQQRVLTMFILMASLLKRVYAIPAFSDASNKAHVVPDGSVTDEEKSYLKKSIMQLLSTSFHESGRMRETGEIKYRVQPLNSDADAFSEVMDDAFFDGELRIRKVEDIEKEKYDKEVSDEQERQKLRGGRKTKVKPFSTDKQTPSIKLAYLYFYDRLDELFSSENKLVMEHGLANVLDLFVRNLRHNFMFASILINKEENPQEIFESLNARSVSLTSFDLIKNMVLMSVPPNRAEMTYIKSWSMFEDKNLEVPFWTHRRSSSFEKSMKVSRENREIFMNYWLAGNMTPTERAKINNVSGEDRHNADAALQSDDGVFWSFKHYMEDKKNPLDFIEVSNRMNRDAEIYKEFTETCQVNDGHIGLSSHFTRTKRPLRGEGVLLGFVYRVIEQMERRSLWQMVFWLRKERSETFISKVEEDKFLHVLESFVIRQFLSIDRVKTENLNQALKNLIVRLCKAEDDALHHNRDVLGDSKAPRIEFKAGTELAKIFRDSMEIEAKRKSKDPSVTKDPQWIDGYVNKNFYLKYPTDAELVESIKKLQLSSNSDIQRIKVILEEVENKRRGFTTPLANSKSTKGLKRCSLKEYQLEHIMPKSWNENWPITGEDPDGSLAAKRNYAVNLLGNFALIEGHINNDLSNGPWTAKLVTLRDKYAYSNKNKMFILYDVFLHQKYIEEYNSKHLDAPKAAWQESHIEARSVKLIKEIYEIWPDISRFQESE